MDLTLPDLTEEERTRRPGHLVESEKFWRGVQPWLKECGYELRARYQPDWTPSWEKNTSLWIYSCEDSISPRHALVLDAKRVSDNSLVILKRIDKSVHPYEADIGQLFSSEPLVSDPRNHCVRIYDVLQVPDHENELILVMPLLRCHDDPPFDTIGEAIDFLTQIFEGLQFMHQNNVAHRDISYFNVMMDASPLYPEPFHPFKPNYKLDLSGPVKPFTRTERPVKYYLTDFGLSRRYNPDDGPPLELPIRGGDKSVPEFRDYNTPCNPFPTDVYCLGNMIKRYFLDGYLHTKGRLGFEFLRPLVADMVQDDPSQRPTMDDAVARFSSLCKTLSNWKLRTRVVERKENVFTSLTIQNLRSSLSGRASARLSLVQYLFSGYYVMMFSSTRLDF